jgi:hypothetical protein
VRSGGELLGAGDDTARSDLDAVLDNDGSGAGSKTDIDDVSEAAASRMSVNRKEKIMSAQRLHLRQRSEVVVVRAHNIRPRLALVLADLELIDRKHGIADL